MFHNIETKRNSDRKKKEKAREEEDLNQQKREAGAKNMSDPPQANCDVILLTNYEVHFSQNVTFARFYPRKCFIFTQT